MKTFRWIMVMFVAVAFITGLTSVSWSERKMIPAAKPKATIQVTSPKATEAKEVTRTCPPGWHVGSVDNFGWTCEPNLPASYQCPEGYAWRKTSECEYICESVELPR